MPSGMMSSVRWLVVAAALAQAVPTAPRNLRIPRRPRHLRRWTGRHLSELLPRASCTRRERQAVEGDVLRRVQRHRSRSDEIDTLLRLELRRLHGVVQYRQGAVSAFAGADIRRHRQAGRRAAGAAVRSSACYQGQCTYKAGLVSTARPRSRQRLRLPVSVHVRLCRVARKFPGTAGFFTAFWMLPTNPNFTYNTEIDIVEILGGHPYDLHDVSLQRQNASFTHRTMACTTTVRARRETTPPTS